jgi:hypothetical protein
VAAENLHAPPRTGDVPELGFSIVGAEAPRDVASPVVRLELRVSAPDRFDVHCLLLDCQVRIAPRRRSYQDPDERDRLTDLFGPFEQWASSMQGILWANLPLFVPRLRGSGAAKLDLPCSYDFEVSAARYLAALADGAIPLEVLFSGTAFWAAEDGSRRVTRVPLDREASFELPVALWREAIDRRFPGAAWLRLSRARFARLQAYRATEALPSWDAVFDSLLSGRGSGGNGAGGR